jgi:HSP20 family protein
MWRGTDMSEPRDFEAEIAKLRDRMNQILSGASMDAEQPEPLDEVDWMPPLDVLENSDEIIVRADVPGMKSDEIDLSISGDILQIKGERKREIEREDENYHAIERGYGRFSRQITLPAPAKVDAIAASYRDGVLTVRLPKIGEKKTGRVKVDLE